MSRSNISKPVKSTLCRIFGKTCYYCGTDLPNPEKLTLDHFFPESYGGPIRGNSVLSCVNCNGKKGDLIPCRDMIEVFVKERIMYPGVNHISPSRFYDEFIEHQSVIDWFMRWTWSNTEATIVKTKNVY